VWRSGCCRVTHQAHPFDLIRRRLSGGGIFLIVFGYSRASPPTGSRGSGNDRRRRGFHFGVCVLAVGQYPRAVIPLKMFADRDFGLCNAGVAVVSFAFTAMIVPLTFYAQAVCGLSPTRSALLLAPMAIASAALAPFVGVLVDRYHTAARARFRLFDAGNRADVAVVRDGPRHTDLAVGAAVRRNGVGSAFVWSPLTATATRNLPPHLAAQALRCTTRSGSLGRCLGAPAWPRS